MARTTTIVASQRVKPTKPSKHNADSVPAVKLEPEITLACEIVQSNKDTMEQIRLLPETMLITLLSPFQSPFKDDSEAYPFEHLGRGISARHAKVAHLPYVLDHGFTASHLEYMRAAGAITVVTLNDILVDEHLAIVANIARKNKVPLAFLQFGGAAKELDQPGLVYLKASHASLETYDLSIHLLFGDEP